MYYIDSAKMLKYLNEMCAESKGDAYIAFDMCRDRARLYLKESNVLQESKRKTAKWKFLKNGFAQCSSCGYTFFGVYDEDDADRYCRHCGAEMSVGEKE